MKTISNLTRELQAARRYESNVIQAAKKELDARIRDLQRRVRSGELIGDPIETYLALNQGLFDPAIEKIFRDTESLLAGKVGQSVLLIERCAQPSQFRNASFGGDYGIQCLRTIGLLDAEKIVFAENYSRHALPIKKYTPVNGSQEAVEDLTSSPAADYPMCFTWSQKVSLSARSAISKIVMRPNSR